MFHIIKKNMYKENCMYILHAVYVQGGKKAPSSLISPLILVDKTD